MKEKTLDAIAEQGSRVFSFALCALRFELLAILRFLSFFSFLCLNETGKGVIFMGNQPKIVTLVFPLDTAYNLVLLGQKREKGGDPGSGRWNGAGGKVEPGETIRGAAVRELREEFCLEAKPEDLRWAATIDFFFGEEHRFRCHVFLAERYQEAKGVRRDGEMERILWHNVHHLPEEMWPSDRIWLVEVLRDRFLGARVVHNRDGSQVLDFRMEYRQPEELIGV